MMKAEWQIIDLIIEVQKTMKLTKKTLHVGTKRGIPEGDSRRKGTSQIRLEWNGSEGLEQAGTCLSRVRPL